MKLLAPSYAENAFGQEIAEHAVLAIVWGQRLEMRTQDAARLGEIDAYAVSRYLVRWRPDLRTAMRIEVDGRVHDIVGIDEPDRRATMILTLEEVTR